MPGGTGLPCFPSSLALGPADLIDDSVTGKGRFSMRPLNFFAKETGSGGVGASKLDSARARGGVGLCLMPRKSSFISQEGGGNTIGGDLCGLTKVLPNDFRRASAVSFCFGNRWVEVVGLLSSALGLEDDILVVSGETTYGLRYVSIRYDNPYMAGEMMLPITSHLP